MSVRDDCRDNCRKSFDHVSLAPMLKDKIWRRLAADDVLLCFNCMLERAAVKRVSLSVNSLEPCVFNLFRMPQSWFDLFMTTAKRPPANIAEWRRAARYAGGPRKVLITRP